MQSAPKPQVDPNLAAQQQQAQQSLIANLQDQAAADTASIMARYGTKLALTGISTSSPQAAPPAPSLASVIAGRSV